MIPELFQTIYIFVSLSVILLLSAILKPKSECTCKVKVPSTIISLLAVLAIGYINGMNPLTYILIGFLVIMTAGSILYPRVDYAGPALYLLGFIGVFTSFEIFGIQEVFELGLENVSMFGALIAIIIMFLKKQENVITVYIIGMTFFFITATTTGFLPLTISSILIILSEVMLIYFREREDSASDEEVLNLSYFSAGLYSFGVVLLPLILL